MWVSNWELHNRTHAHTHTHAHKYQHLYEHTKTPTPILTHTHLVRVQERMPRWGQDKKQKWSCQRTVFGRWELSYRNSVANVQMQNKSYVEGLDETRDKQTTTKTYRSPPGRSETATGWLHPVQQSSSVQSEYSHSIWRGWGGRWVRVRVGREL